MFKDVKTVHATCHLHDIACSDHILMLASKKSCIDVAECIPVGVFRELEPAGKEGPRGRERAGALGRSTSALAPIHAPWAFPSADF